MCFLHIPFSNFFKKKDIVGDDDESTSSMPGLHEFHFSARMIGVNISPRQDPHSFDTLVFTDDDGVDDVVVDLLSCDDDDDDDDDGDEDGGFVYDDDDEDEEEVGFVFYKPRPPWNRYYAMLKREKERGLDMEFFDLYLFNRKKAEDRRTRILDWNGIDDARDDAGDRYGRDDRDDNASIAVEAD
jgi:hypothetical protein